MTTSTPVKIGTRHYDVDLGRMARRPLSSMRQMVDQGQEPSEQSLDTQGLWKRTADDFILGAGQDYFDQTEESSRRRHRASKGFEMLSDRRMLQTQPQLDATDVTGLTLGGTHKRMVRTDGNYWVGSSNGLVRSTGLDGFVGSVAITGEPGSGFRDLACFNQTVYAAYNTNGIYSGSASGSSIASLAAVNCDRLAVAHGRLIGAYGSELFEISAAGAKTTIYTHPETAVWRWYGITAGSAGIYVAGSSTLKTEIHLIGVVDATGALAPPFPVAELPPGEIVNRIVFFGGYLVIASNRGVRVARSNQSGYLEYGPLLTFFGNVQGVVTDGRYCFATCDDLPTLGGAGIIKLDLSRFTAPLVPAWCVEHHIIPDPGDYTIHDVSSHFTSGTTKVAALVEDNDSGEGALHTTCTEGLTQDAEYWSGLITYGTPESKGVISLEGTWDPLPAGTTLTMEIWDKYGGSSYGSATFGAGSTEGRVYPIEPLNSETIEVRIVAEPATNTVIKVRRWTLRAIPRPFKSEEVILPLMLSRHTDSYGGVNSYEGLEEWSYLNGLMQSRQQVDFVFGAQTERVYVDAVIVDPGSAGFATWDGQGTWPDGTVVVRLITIETD